jgi:dolichyl-diphosphooligosaccharide---protein glycosyltransferase
MYYCFKKLTDANIFIIIYGVTSIYFAGVMVRLMLVLAPVMCVLSGIGISSILCIYARNAEPDSAAEKKNRRGESTYWLKSEVDFC